MTSVEDSIRKGLSQNLENLSQVLTCRSDFASAQSQSLQEELKPRFQISDDYDDSL